MTHSSIVFLVQQLENDYVHYDVMMLEYIQSRPLPSCNSIKTIEFSTLYYSTIPHSKLKNRLRELVQLSFINKSGQRRYKYLVIGRDRVFCKIAR
jgi:hypothetical protein